MNNEQQQYKYFAFISYNSNDAKEAFRLQRKLEHYSLPADIAKKHSYKKRPVDPVFFAETDILPGNLNPELESRLESSRYLIVVCSPRSAQSKWVGKEIEYFISLGRKERILLFIVDGIPGSGNPETECFHPVIQEHLTMDYLGANIHEASVAIPKRLWRERAYTQIVSKMLGLDFDDLWQRHLKDLRRKRNLSIMGAVLVVLSILGSIYWASRPIAMTISLQEAFPANSNLYADDGVVTIKLGDEIRTDTIHHLPTQITFINIPRTYRGKLISLQYRQPGFDAIDTIILVESAVAISLRRSPAYYGHIIGYTLRASTNEAVPNVKLRIHQYETVSDQQGHFAFDIPIESQQSNSYSVKIYHNEQLCGEDLVYPILDAPTTRINQVKIQQ